GRRAREAAPRAPSYARPPGRNAAASASFLFVEKRQGEGAAGIGEDGEERPAAPGPEFRARRQYFAQHAELLARTRLEAGEEQHVAVGLAPGEIAQAILERVPVAAEPFGERERAGKGLEHVPGEVDFSQRQLAFARSVDDVIGARHAVDAGAR